MITSGPPTKCADIALIRAHIEAVPTPTFLTSVGKISVAKTYTTAYATLMSPLPNRDRTVTVVRKSVKDYTNLAKYIVC